MPTVLTHAVAGAALGFLLGPRQRLGAFTAVAAVVSVLPDVDVTGYYLGIRYGELLGHRGLTHSLLAAGIVATVAGLLLRTWRAGLAMFVVAVSHGALDAMTSGGYGVAFFAPFDLHRYAFPFTPIEAAPLHPSAFFTAHGAAVLASELVWVWIPAILLAAWTAGVRFRGRQPSTAQTP